MLAALFAPAVISALFSAGVDLFKQYQQGKITLEELRTKLGVIALQEGTKWEQANADMVKQTYGDFSRMVMSSGIVQSCYAFVVVTQTCVLIWAQMEYHGWFGDMVALIRPRASRLTGGMHY